MPTWETIRNNYCLDIPIAQIRKQKLKQRNKKQISLKLLSWK